MSYDNVCQQRSNLASCAEVLAGLRFEKDLIRQIFQEDTMRESVIYQDILQQGLQEGRKNEALSLVNRLLNRQVGELDSSLQTQIQALSLTQLEALSEALLDFSAVADVVAWLEQQATSLAPNS